MNSCIALAGGLVLAVILSGCKSPYYADKGAAAGALTGAAAGALIGEHNDNPLLGAAIGTTVGAVTGAAIGQSIDEDIARNNLLVEQQLGRRLAGAATLSDVASMSQAGLSDEVIVTHIRGHGVAHPVTPDELIFLKQQGVSDRVINAMQSTPPPTVVAPRSGPVIIEEHHYVAPRYPRPPHWHYHSRPRYHRPGTGVHWGVSFGH